MNATASPVPHASGSTDRMGVAFLFSLMLHAIFILGVGFSLAKPAPSLPTLDVTLINTSNAQTPEKADFLAQADNAGGGTSDEAHRPGAPFSGPLPVTRAGIAPRPMMPAAPAQQTASGPHVLTTTGHSKTRVAEQRDSREQPKPPGRQANVPIPQRLEMARLAQEVRREQQAYARRPRRKYVSANTKSVAFAAYQVAWVHRIERIGNLNYPDAARTQHLHGELIMTVLLAPDGRVRNVVINRSSGYRILDDAATRIVRLASPFAAIPQEQDASGQRIDELAITRTWQFLPGGHLETRGTQSR